MAGFLDSMKKSANIASTANLGTGAKNTVAKAEQPKKVEPEKPKKNFVENNNEAISKAKVGDYVKRDDGTEVQLGQGDIDFAGDQFQKAQAALVETATDEDQNLMDGDPVKVADEADKLESDIVKTPETINPDGSKAPAVTYSQDEFLSMFGNNDLKTEIDESGNVKLAQGSFNASAPTTFEQGRLKNNPYEEQMKKLEPDYKKEKEGIDFATKLTKYSAIAYIFSGGRIPFVDFRQLAPRDAYDAYVEMMEKVPEEQAKALSEVQSSADQRTQGQYGLLKGQQEQQTQLKMIDANVEADLRRYDAQTMGELDKIRAQGDVQAKLTRLSHLLQSQEMGDMIDDLRGRGYSETDIAHWIMASKLGISPGQQAYQNVMNGVKAAGDVVSAIANIIP